MFSKISQNLYLKNILQYAPEEARFINKELKRQVMWKIILWSSALIATGVILRRTHILDKLRDRFFEKVDMITGTQTPARSTTI